MIGLSVNARRGCGCLSRCRSRHRILSLLKVQLERDETSDGIRNESAKKVPAAGGTVRSLFK